MSKKEVDDTCVHLVEMVGHYKSMCIAVYLYEGLTPTQHSKMLQFDNRGDK